VFWCTERQIPVMSSTLLGVPIAFGGGGVELLHATNVHNATAIAIASAHRAFTVAARRADSCE
jgi:hypothetical protein